MSPTPPVVTERDVLDSLLRRFNARLAAYSPVPRYVCATHVRLHGGYSSLLTGTRVCDFLAMDTRVSAHYALHGAEVKVSRSDWLVELRDPTKAAAFARHCDYWWLAVADASVARPEELPEGWGLLVRQRDGRLRTVREAARRTPVPARGDDGGIDHGDLPREFVAMFLRRALLTERERTSESESPAPSDGGSGGD